MIHLHPHFSFTPRNFLFLLLLWYGTRVTISSSTIRVLSCFHSTLEGLCRNQPAWFIPTSNLDWCHQGHPSRSCLTPKSKSTRTPSKSSQQELCLNHWILSILMQGFHQKLMMLLTMMSGLMMMTKRIHLAAFVARWCRMAMHQFVWRSGKLIKCCMNFGLIFLAVLHHGTNE